MSQDFRNWKRYRGGWSPDLWLFDLKTFASRNITNNPANDAQPMWYRNTIYFVSDRGASQRNNIWAEDVATGSVREVTKFLDFDVTFPSIGPDAIVFQAGGRLYLLGLPGEKLSEVPVRLVTDETPLRARTAKAEALVASASVSPAGKRAVFEARGDIVTIPAEHGALVPVTRTSGVADRYPRWSPDGKTIAYWSDRSGEYELTLRAADGSGAERKITSLGPGFRYPPQWAPDNKKLLASLRQDTGRQVASPLHTDLDRLESREPRFGSETELAGEQHVIANGGVEVERKMRGVHRDVVRNQSAHALVYVPPNGLNARPEESMVNDQQVGSLLDRPFDRAR